MLGLVQFLRATGAKGQPAMIRTEVQPWPWPILDIMRLQGDQAMVRLRDWNPSSSRMQMVRLERSGTSWNVVQIVVGAP